ncbi:MAG TPA: PAS domain S-box protein [Candidatus Sulfotelmatobacter sp.]|nr:PAS domain S-box protein [Candidatus Sulfotelmatobacter sp.]
MTAETQSATRTSEPLDLQMLIETIPALVICALADGSVEFANRAWQEYAGGSLQQTRGSGWQTGIHPDDVRCFAEEWNAGLSTGKPFATEARMRRADGQYHWFLIRKALAIPPNQGDDSSLRTLIVCEDIDERKQAEARLHQSETQLQTFFENSPSMIFLKDREGRYLYANREFKRVRRITEQQINGKTDNELFPAEQASVFQASDRQVREAGVPIEYEHVTVQNDGQHTSIVQKFPLFNPDGEIYAIGGIVRDITERKREEMARRYIEESHRLIVETASDVVVTMDETGTIRSANPSTTRIFGYESAELIGKPLTVLMPEFMRKLHDSGFRRYLATGQRHINWQGTELTAMRKNGEEFPVEISFGELTRDGHKVFTGFIRDISARKHAEEKLRASERTLRELTETIPQMLWSAEADGAVDYCNQRVLDYTGLSGEQVKGAGWMKTVHHDDIAKMARAWSEAVLSGQPFQHEFRCLRGADRAYRWCISRALPLRDQSGRILKWFGTVVDLHDWKEAQQALQVTQAELARVSRLTTMGELAASIAHEVNQPLTAVTNNSSACLRLLAKGNLDPEVLRRVLEEIVADATRASAVISRIRAYIKKAPTEMCELDINSVIQEVLALAGHDLQNNQVSVDCHLTEKLPHVQADRVQLQQVLLNLIMNGVEAMTGAQSRTLSLESRTDESGNVLVAVGDSGTGLGSESDCLFTPFFTTKGNGMGMGLPISRSLIESHGGRLWATANSPQGAMFSFTLPASSESHS